MNMEGHPCMSHKSDEWATPQALYDRLNKKFDFQLDPCCTEENMKAPIGIGLPRDGLAADWSYHKRVFVNPPYSQVAKWVQKAYEESRKGCIVVCLVKSCTDTKWWHEYAMKADVIIFLQGRVKFGGATTGAPFPSCILVFKNNCPAQPVQIRTMKVKA